MSKSITKMLLVVAILLSSASGFAQKPNLKTETAKVYGNCDMCKSTIEKAGNVRKVAAVEWNKNTRMATLTYDSKKTTPAEILKRIALAGYDSEEFLAPDDVYAKLPGCCQYNRILKPVAKPGDKSAAAENEHGSHNHGETILANAAATQNVSQLKTVFDNYFSVKDALIKTDAAATSIKAGELAKAIKAVEMTKLSAGEHAVWMNVMKDLTANAEKIADTRDISKQRENFASLSKNMYELAKASKQDTPVYYQHCPMYNNGKGANWLSKESTIKNPYYGTQMLTCGSIQEKLD